MVWRTPLSGALQGKPSLSLATGPRGMGCSKRLHALTLTSPPMMVAFLLPGLGFEGPAACRAAMGMTHS
jgi:hypothetical protein